MPANLRILTPDGTTNYIANPSMRYDILGYTAFGSTLSRTLAYARYNIASMMVVTNGAALGEGVYYRVNSLLGISDPITGSVYVRGSGIVRLRVIDNPVGKQWFTDPITLTDRWTRLFVSGFSTGTSDVRIYVETASRIQAATFYVDGWQLERKPYPTTFCDGDQDGCRWDGMYHASSSSRSAYTRAGGRWIDLAGPCREEDDIYVTVLAGMGTIPQQSQTQSWALQAGSFFQDAKILNRKMTLTFFIKNAKRLSGGQPDLRPLHKLRQQLIDVIKPDVTQDSQEFLLEYQEGDKPLYLSARYESGLEGEWDIRNQWVNSFPVMLSATYPFFQEDNKNVTVLDVQDTLSKATKVMKILVRADGVWRLVSEDGTGYWPVSPLPIYGETVGLRGEMYFVGDKIWKWDGISLTIIGVVTAGTAVQRATVAPNGDLYVGGIFTAINGVAAKNVAKWDGSSWSALGAGLDTAGMSGVYAMIIAQNGQLYVGGQFQKAAGMNVNNITRWDGSAWGPVGAIPGLSHAVYSFANAIDGKTLYVGGQFQYEYGMVGQHLMAVAAINLDTNLFSPLGNGLGSAGKVVEDIVVDKDGTLIAVGGFTRDGLGGGPLLEGVAYWNGESFYPIGSGSDIPTLTDFKRVAIDPVTREIAIGGVFSSPSLGTNLMKWVGDRRSTGKYAQIDLVLPSIWGQTVIQDIAFAPNGDFYVVGQETIALRGFSSALIPGINYVNNTGSANAHPIVYVKGPGTFRLMQNLTTGITAYFSLVVLQNEEVIIDFGRGKITSTVRGNMLSALLPVFSMGDFVLAPGENKILVLVTEDVGFVAQISYIPQHHSADASAKIEELQ